MTTTTQHAPCPMCGAILTTPSCSTCGESIAVNNRPPLLFSGLSLLLAAGCSGFGVYLLGYSIIFLLHSWPAIERSNLVETQLAFLAPLFIVGVFGLTFLYAGVRVFHRQLIGYLVSAILLTFAEVMVLLATAFVHFGANSKWFVATYLVFMIIAWTGWAWARRLKAAEASPTGPRTAYSAPP